jgi:hypothetical protein
MMFLIMHISLLGGKILPLQMITSITCMTKSSSTNIFFLLPEN